MSNSTTTSSMTPVPSLKAAWQDVDSSFERFCLTAGIGAIEQMLCEDAQRLAGARHSRGDRAGHRWGTTKGHWRQPLKPRRQQQRTANVILSGCVSRH